MPTPDPELDAPRNFPMGGRRALRTTLAVSYFGACLLAQVWPSAAWANRVEPRVMGLPFLFFWYVAGILAVFAGLLVLYLLERAEAAGDLHAEAGPEGRSHEAPGDPTPPERDRHRPERDRNLSPRRQPFEESSDG